MSTTTPRPRPPLTPEARRRRPGGRPRPRNAHRAADRAAAERRPRGHRIAIVLVAQLMLVLDATVVNVALPRIDADLGFGPASLSWVLNAYTLAFGGLLLLGGRLGDVRGRLRLFEIGLALFTLASVARRARPDAGPAGRRPRGAGGRRRPGRPERARPAHHQRPGRGRPAPRARPVRGRLLRRRLARPAPRRRRDRPGLVALDAVHQRADRPRRPRARPPLRRRDRPPSRPLRRGRRRHGHPRRRRAGVGPDRHPRARLDLRAHPARLRRRRGSCWACSRSPSAASSTRWSGPRCCAAAAGSPRSR